MYVCMSFFPGSKSKKDRERLKRKISFSLSLSLYPPFASPTAASSSPLVFVCYKDRQCSLLSFFLYFSLFFFIEGERENELTMKMVVACRSSRSWWPLIVKVFVKKKRVLFFYFYIFFVCVCYLHPFLFLLSSTHRENNNNNNELYVFVLILKWRNELLSREDNHRNHKMSDAKKRKYTHTTTRIFYFIFQNESKDAGFSMCFYDSFVLRVLVAMTTQRCVSQWPRSLLGQEHTSPLYNK